VSVILFCGTVALSAASAEDNIPRNSGEMLKSASDGVTHVESVISSGQEMLADAKLEADVTRMDCLNAQLINAKGYYNVVQNGEANLRDAVSRNDEAAQQHHYKLVQLAVSKIDNIAARMQECTSGLFGNITGETRQETHRKCAIEPCLGGEEYYDPSIANELQYMEQSAVDASPYL